MNHAATLADKQQIEIEFWKNSPLERPESVAVENIVNKMAEAQVFLALLDKYTSHFANASSALELGAGQGWGSCLVKARFPHLRLTTTDISPYAVASLDKWSRILGAAPDDSYACTSYETREPDASLDLVFCYAAAHHFLAHRRTLAELARILRPGGTCLYLYEPTSPRYLYRLAHWRVNRKRPEVPEDVLICRELRRLCAATGLKLSVDYYPSNRHRGPTETVYYTALSKVPFLRRLLPCTANLVIEKV